MTGADIAGDARRGDEQQVERVSIPDNPGFYRRGRWVVFPYRDRRGRQHWGKARNLTEARRRRAELITDVARGEHRARSRVKFEDYARECLRTYQGRTRKAIEEHTRANYLQNLEQNAIPFFEGMLLSEVEPADIKAYAAAVAKRGPACRACRNRPEKRRECERCKGTGHGKGTLSPDSVRLALAPVKIVFATAFEGGVIRVNPAAGVRVLRPQTSTRTPAIDDEDEGDVKALTEQEVAAVFAALAAKETWARWLLFFRVLLELGLRISEVIELRWRDIDLGAGSVKVRRKFYRGRVGPPKSRYGRRTLRLTPAASRALWDLRKESRARDGDLVFTATRGARIHAPNLMRDVLKPAAVAAGVGDWVGFHTFRHTCATLLFTKAKWNPKQVQLWLGHHSASFTVDTYIHLLPSDLPEPAELAPAIAVDVRSEDGAGGSRTRVRTGVAS